MLGNSFCVNTSDSSQGTITVLDAPTILSFQSSPLSSQTVSPFSTHLSICLPQSYESYSRTSPLFVSIGSTADQVTPLSYETMCISFSYLVYVSSSQMYSPWTTSHLSIGFPQSYESYARTSPLFVSIGSTADQVTPLSYETMCISVWYLVYVSSSQVYSP